MKQLDLFETADTRGADITMVGSDMSQGTSVTCEIVEEVVAGFRDRARVGKEKYGVDMTRTDIDLEGWLQHLLEEVMDAAVYLTRIKRDLKQD